MKHKPITNSTFLTNLRTRIKYESRETDDGDEENVVVSETISIYPLEERWIYIDRIIEQFLYKHDKFISIDRYPLNIIPINGEIGYMTVGNNVHRYILPKRNW